MAELNDITLTFGSLALLHEDTALHSMIIKLLSMYLKHNLHLPVEDSSKIEQVQKTCLKVILGQMYVSYSAALEMTGLTPLSTRREERCLNFAVKCVRHPRNSRLFPFKKEGVYDDQYLRKSETFEVNFASGSIYKKSAIPYCQRLLNSYVAKKKTM